MPAITLASLRWKSCVAGIDLLLDDGTVSYVNNTYKAATGPLERRLKSLGQMTLALSDDLTGQHTLPSYTVTLLDGRLPGASDAARVIRALYEETAFKGREVIAWIADTTTLATGGTRATLFRALIQTVQFRGLEVQLGCVDFLTGQGKAADFAAVRPRRLITRRCFPGLREDHPALGLSVPYVFGIHDDVAPGYGPIPLIPLDEEVMAFNGVTYRRFLLAGHAIESIDALFAGSVPLDLGGTNILVPGYAGWALFFGGGSPPTYLDINGERFTIVYVFPGVEWHDNAVAGSVKLTATCHGWEDSVDGDGSGSTIEDLFDQELAYWANLALGTHRLEPLTIPTFGSDSLSYVDTASYAAAQTVAATRISGGITGAWMIGGYAGAKAPADTLAMLRRCTDTRGTWTLDGQYRIKMYDRVESASANVLGLQGTDYLLTSAELGISPLDDHHFTQLRVNYGRQYVSDGWYRKDVVIRAAYGISDYSAQDSPVFDCDALRDFSIVRVQARHRLSRYANARLAVTSPTSPLIEVSGTGHLPIAALEMGSVNPLTHPLAPGAEGWVSHKTDLERVSVDLDSAVVSFTVRDHDQPRPHTELVLWGLTITSITRGGADNRTATAVVVDDITDLVAEGDILTIEGVTPDDYNGSWAVTVLSSTSYSFLMPANPGANGSGTMTWGTYDTGHRRTLPKSVKEVDPVTGTGPIIQSEWDLGGSLETTLNPSAATIVDFKEFKLAEIDKSQVGRRRVVARLICSTDDGASDLTGYITLADNTTIPGASGQPDPVNPTTLTRFNIVLQDLEADSPIDRILDGTNLYKGRFEKSNALGNILFAGDIKVY